MSKESKRPTSPEDEVIRDKDYFNSERFDCTPEFLLNQLAVRATHWSKKTDGTYSVPRGETGQIYEMAIAATLKNAAIKCLRELAFDDLEIVKRIAKIEGEPFYDMPESQPTKIILGHLDNPLEDKSRGFYLMAKHEITRIKHPDAGWCYQATDGDMTLIPVQRFGDNKAICLAVLAKHKQLN